MWATAHNGCSSFDPHDQAALHEYHGTEFSKSGRNDFSLIAYQAQAVEIVHNHGPAATIVKDQAASAQVRASSQTLQTYIQKSTGAKLPIASVQGLASHELDLKRGGWVTATIPFQLPDNPQFAKLRFLVTFEGLSPNGEIYLDGVGIYRIGD